LQGTYKLYLVPVPVEIAQAKSQTSVSCLVGLRREGRFRAKAKKFRTCAGDIDPAVSDIL
jgi:hypothetical protein